MKIGMLVAVEMDAVFKAYADQLETLEFPGYTVYCYEMNGATIYALESGAGEIAAAAGTQFLITRFEVDMIVNFGVVGGLTEEMTVTRACVVEKVVHYDFDTSAVDGCVQGHYMELYPDVYIPATEALVDQAQAVEPGLKRVICASGDKFVADSEAKRKLHLQFGAEICEMEAAGIVLTCNRCGVPCLLIKTVSDSIHGGAREFLEAVDETAEICLKILERILLEGMADRIGQIKYDRSNITDQI